MCLKMSTKREVNCKCPWNVKTWNLFIQVFLLLFAALVVAAVITGVVVGKNSNAVLRFSIRATPDQVYPPGSGEEGALLDGTLTMDYVDMKFAFDFFYYNISTIQSIIVRGPRAAGQRQGPLLFSFCGVPNTITVCDVFSTPGQVTEPGTQELHPGPLSARPLLIEIRENPTRYYLEILTSNHPSEPGALRADFTSVVGAPF